MRRLTLARSSWGQMTAVFVLQQMNINDAVKAMPHLFQEYMQKIRDAHRGGDS